jgi:hypothetical protein
MSNHLEKALRQTCKEMLMLGRGVVPPAFKRK